MDHDGLTDKCRHRSISTVMSASNGATGGCGAIVTRLWAVKVKSHCPLMKASAPCLTCAPLKVAAVIGLSADTVNAELSKVDPN